MALSVREVVAAAQQLTASEQREVIQALSRGLQPQLPQSVPQKTPPAQHPPQRDSAESPSSPREWPFVIPPPVQIPNNIRRTQPIADLSRLVAHFWPTDETSDDINSFITEQRTKDQLSDTPDKLGDV